MEVKCLDELIVFTSGKNLTRMKEQKINVYTQEDFEKDLHCINEPDGKACCIINLIKSKTAPISKATTDKLITSNFLCCQFDEQILDQWYFCYQFNEGKEVQQQIAMYHQGTTLSVKKLTVRTIGELKIPLPDIKRQQTIGEMYRQLLIQNDLMIKQAEDMRKCTLAVIRKIEEDEKWQKVKIY